MSASIVGAIEAGGTKFQCALARGPEDILVSSRIATTTPLETLTAVADFFVRAQAEHGAMTAVGVGTFGPVDLDRRSPTYGHILPTPKPGWTGADLLGELSRGLRVPVLLDTDVNAAAIAELTFGAGQGLNSLCYVTVGTGIGAGVVIEGRPLHGMLHPEMGHMVVQRHPRDREFPGICPFHRDCLEGLACGPAIKARWGAAISELAPSTQAHSIIGFYLGQLTANVALMLSCQRVIFGGGVMTGGSMLPWIREHAGAFLNGYLPSPQLHDRLDGYVVAPGLGERSGLVGAIALAMGILNT